ncbi:uncharacterized protein LOC143298633 [Babylonia areolata]|uniref:uncharacterized protein LOC143298633 n=1 Tax=Babylonia areolata TaxID=304850 RepID=UPI003FCF8771
MDGSTFTCITPELTRLVSFKRTPLPIHLKYSISNSPAKLAKAGFMRRTDASKDEVCCESCGVVYGDWEGESPLAVHRVLSEKCPILINSTADDVLNHPSVKRARRQLFPEPERTHNTSDEEDERDNADDSVRERTNGREDETNNSEETVHNNNAGDNDHDDSTVSLSEQSNSDTESEPDTNNVTQSVPLQPSYVSVLSQQANFAFPYEPPVGGFSSLFASRRLKTFPDSGCPDCIEWAEEGFVYRTATRDVQCVFCTLILPFNTVTVYQPQQAHAEKSVSCPRVLLIDVGNISTADEERIRLKNLQRQLKDKSSPDRHYTICHPQYEEESVRLGTFVNWPHSSWDDHLQPSLMAQAGFYFTGCADKVKCYSCDLGLYQWRQGSDPWEQHAHHMPACPHLAVKGQHFIEQAAQAQVLTEADLPTATATSSPSNTNTGSITGDLTTSPPGALTLDTCAVTAALSTSQYTVQQVRHAVLTFFFHTGRFPTKDILLGTLKAADENFTTVCEQREALHQKDSALQQKDTALQQKDTVIQQKDTVIQQKDTVIQQKDTVIQQKDTIIQQHRLELSLKDEELQAREEELQAREEELERRRREMSYQESQINSLRIQMQALLAERRQAGRQAAPLQAPAAAAAQAALNDGGDAPDPVVCDIRCKVCLSEDSNTIFVPCQHVTCCSRCAHQLFNDRCPVCRAPIEGVLPAYIS